MSNRRRLRSKPPAHRSRGRPRKLIDRLGQNRPTTRIGIASLLLGIVGVGLTLYFGLWSSSPEPVIGKPIPTTTGGQNPASLFDGQHCASVQGTTIILYNLENVLNCASLVKGPMRMLLGTSQPESYCANSYAMPRPGVYRCVVQVNGINTIADPCFGVTRGQVECQLPNGIFGLLYVINITDPRPYDPSLSELGRQYPFRLELDNGMTCTWNWLPFMGHTGGGWICTPPLAGVDFEPVRENKFLEGRNALNYNGAFVIGKQYIYYAEDLAQGSQNTWSVLLEGPDNPGIFNRESVTQAWY